MTWWCQWLVLGTQQGSAPRKQLQIWSPRRCPEGALTVKSQEGPEGWVSSEAKRPQWLPLQWILGRRENVNSEYPQLTEFNASVPPVPGAVLGLPSQSTNVTDECDKPSSTHSLKSRRRSLLLPLTDQKIPGNMIWLKWGINMWTLRKIQTPKHPNSSPVKELHAPYSPPRKIYCTCLPCAECRAGNCERKSPCPGALGDAKAQHSPPCDKVRPEEHGYMRCRRTPGHLEGKGLTFSCACGLKGL